MANYIYIETENSTQDKSYGDFLLERGQDTKSQLMFFSKPRFNSVRLNLLCEASDIGGYNQLNQTAFDASCEYFNTFPLLDEQKVLRNFITDSGYPALDITLSGTWILYIRAKGYSSPTPPTPPEPYIGAWVYKRTTGGVETLLFSFGETLMPNNNLYANYTISATASGVISLTDRIVLRVFGVFHPSIPP